MPICNTVIFNKVSLLGRIDFKELCLPPLCSTYLPSLAHLLLKLFFGRPCHWLSRIGWLLFRNCNAIQASHSRRNGKKIEVSSTLRFLATACWGRTWGCQFFFLFCSVVDQASYVLMMNFVCPFMTIKRRSLQPPFIYIMSIWYCVLATCFKIYYLHRLLIWHLKYRIHEKKQKKYTSV